MQIICIFSSETGKPAGHKPQNSFVQADLSLTHNIWIWTLFSFFFAHAKGAYLITDTGHLQVFAYIYIWSY